MTPDELRKTSEFYNDNAASWRFYQHAYEGTEALINKELILRSDIDRRDPEDIAYREYAAWGEDLSGWIVDILSDFIGTSKFTEDFDAIINDWSFAEFLEDCDLYGTNWDVFWNDSRKAVGATGMHGILVDKGNYGQADVDFVKQKKIYPYVVRYSPLSVLDINYDRDPDSNRPVLTYLKLMESDNTYKIWRQEEWEQWAITNGQAIMINNGTNPLGFIPFCWFYNIKSVFDHQLGVSDIKNIAKIDSSIIQSTADIAQIMHTAGFLMLLRPTSAIREDPDIKVGPREVIPFDADNPSGTKPSWLSPDLGAPINATLQIIKKQEEVAIRRKNLGAVFAAMSNDARSSDSIKQVMRFLEAELNRKVINEVEARRTVLYFWLSWQGMQDVYDKIIVTHSKQYDISTMMLTLQDALTAKSIVRSSPLFQKRIDKLVAKRTDIDMPPDVQKEIYDEIDKAKQPEPDANGMVVKKPIDKQS